VPPNRLRSITATFIPAPDKLSANAGPDCPVPITIASNVVGIKCLLFNFTLRLFKSLLISLFQREKKKCKKIDSETILK
jgi:hypothetical protein